MNEGGGQGVFGSGSPGVKGQSDTGDGVLGVSKGRGFSGVTGINEGGGRGLTAVGSPAGHFDGDVEVTGDIRLVNQDVAEDFDVQDVAGIEPGAVMVFDTDGKLRPCRQPYDKKVAGVIAGAGDFKPAIVLGKLPSAQGRLPIALVGKVYCRIDAQYGHVEVGDLLTTSSTPGYAMKATDPTKAFGAVIGKALRAIDTGQALIPILIALQ